MKRATFLKWSGLAASLLLLLAVPAFAQGQAVEQKAPAGSLQDGGLWLPYAASSYSDDIDFLYRVIFWVTTGMFILTEGLLLLFCVIYRRRPGHRPTYTHGNNKAEIAWTIIPALMLLGLAIWQIPTWNHIKAKFPEKGDPNNPLLVIDVLGEQYKWNFRYPGTKAQFKADNDFTNLSNVHVPFGHTALFNLRSKDVIHSVYIPHMRVKQDTVPGVRQKLWFKPNRFYLIDIAGGLHADGQNYYKLENNEWTKKPWEVQNRVWVYENSQKDLPQGAFLAKDFEDGGKLWNEKVVVLGHVEENGVYGPMKFNGAPKKVKILHKGIVSEGQFTDAKYCTGIFEIACAELCGLGHYTMRAFLYVDPPAAYTSWLKNEMDDLSDPAPAWKFWRD